jgi:hypothetical protein
MSDRYHSLTVVLDEPMRDDDAEKIMNAIRCLRGVVAVEGNVADSGHFVAMSSARHELRGKLWEALK